MPPLLLFVSIEGKLPNKNGDIDNRENIAVADMKIMTRRSCDGGLEYRRNCGRLVRLLRRPLLLLDVGDDVVPSPLLMLRFVIDAYRHRRLGK